MPTWMTAEQISSRYAVGEQRLREYAQRGNLAMYRLDDGSVLFDGEGAARYFRSRNAVMMHDPDARNMGVVGTTRLGDGYVASAMGPQANHDTRRQPVRLSGMNAAVRKDFARTG